MNYCTACSIAFDGAHCSNCGTEPTKVVEADDFCFLIKKDPVWSGMVKDILKQNGIVYTAKAEMGTAFAIEIAPANERYSFFVPFALLEKAKSLMDEVFNSQQEVDIQ